jgi:uncharacterized membrane protein YqjE
MSTADDRSFASVLTDVVGNVQQIIRAEVRLAKVELRETAGKAKRGAVLLAAGGVAVVFALGFALLAGVYALSTVWPPWAAALAVALLSGVAGAVVVAAGLKQMRTIDVVPPKTVATVQENIQWVKTRAR